ncbi:mitochondrial fission ELM1 family protein [Pelagibacteraceae bacterium]|nr:mitochondrial fission ELM1 family protein [Pelagibacteraceae bacterium]
MNNFNRDNFAWCITDGSAGMISQVKGLALAMNLEFTLKEVKVNFPWNILPVGVIPIVKSTFSNFSEFSENIPPKFLISCGRKSVYLSLFLKRKYKEKVVTIHIQNPKSKYDEFDLIISPKHDNLSLANSFVTSLAINHISENLIKEEMDKFSYLVNSDDTPICAVLIGGQSNNYIFDNNEVDELIKKIKKIKENQKIKFFFLFSRRTEKNIVNKINTAFIESEIVWSDKKVNPYIALLGFSKYIICTSDSVSMISEAISAMKPVYIFRLQSSKSKNRIENFNDYVILEGLARKLDYKLEEFKHDYKNETAIIAEKIRNKFKQ